MPTAHRAAVPSESEPLRRAPTARRPAAWRLILAVGLIGSFGLAWLSSPVSAQEVSGLQAAVALEEVLTTAIAGAERSVVAISRVSRRDFDDRNAFGPRPDPIGPIHILAPPPRPGDSGFVADDYGTGVVIDRQGLILTNYHVLGEEHLTGDDSDFFVTLSDRKLFKARLIGADPRSDLAVLKIEATDLQPIKFGDSSALKKGQIVIALGNPYAIARDGQASASWGIVANFQRKAPSTGDENNASTHRTIHQLGTLIQTDAKLNLGTSGGALLNLKGEMIGLTTALAAVAGYEQAAGYAIPVDDTFRRVVDTLKQGSEVEYGFLGVKPENLSEREVEDGLHGVRVQQVVAGTPAERYGLLTNDVITHVNGRPISNSEGLMLQVGKLPVESPVQLTVLRAGERLPIVAELSKFPVRGKKVVTNPAPSWRGLCVDYVTAGLPSSDRVNDIKIDPRGCVMIIEVDPSSAAWQLGLRPNMVISHVGKTRVNSPKAFHAAVADGTGPIKLVSYTGTPDNPSFTIPPDAPGDDYER